VNDKAEILWRMANEHYTQGRHHETQRSAMSQIVFVIAGALLAFTGSNGATNPGRELIAGCLIVLGIVGAVFSMKQYERSRLHASIGGAHRSQLESIISVDLGHIRNLAEAGHDARNSRLVRIRLHWLWALMHLGISLLGVVLLVMVISGWFPTTAA
jgi:hypothetical protein